MTEYSLIDKTVSNILFYVDLQEKQDQKELTNSDIIFSVLYVYNGVVYKPTDFFPLVQTHLVNFCKMKRIEKYSVEQLRIHCMLTPDLLVNEFMDNVDYVSSTLGIDMLEGKSKDEVMEMISGYSLMYLWFYLFLMKEKNFTGKIQTRRGFSESFYRTFIQKKLEPSENEINK